MKLTLNTNRIASGSGIVPPTLLDEKRIPKFYQDAIAMCGATTNNQCPNTAQVCKLMSLSQLPQSVLGNIWSLVNRTKPGQLTREEFYSCLALIALAQKGESLSALCDVTTLPIPFIQTFSVSSPNTEQLPKHANFATSKEQRSTQVTTKSTIQTPNRTSDELLQDILDVSKTSRNNSSLNVAAPRIIPTSLNSGMTEDVNDSNNLCSLDFIDFNGVPTTLPNNTDDEISVNVPLDLQKLSERALIWKQCFLEATVIFNEASELFSSYSPQIHEVLETETGYEYARSLKAVQSVVNRITQTLDTYESDSLPAEVREIFDIQKNTVAKWESLNELLCEEKLNLNGAENGGAKSSHSNTLCSICLQPMDRFVFTCEAIDFLGHTYHSQCANFYLNRRIGALLPNLI